MLTEDGDGEGNEPGESESEEYERRYKKGEVGEHDYKEHRQYGPFVLK